MMKNKKKIRSISIFFEKLWPVKGYDFMHFFYEIKHYDVIDVITMISEIIAL
jgi:hypothetical protein